MNLRFVGVDALLDLRLHGDEGPERLRVLLSREIVFEGGDHAQVLLKDLS